MLVLSRHIGETIILTLPDSRRVTITVCQLRGYDARARLGIDAPADVTIHRGEVQAEIDAAAGGPANGPAPAPPRQGAPQSAGNGPPRDRRGNGAVLAVPCPKCDAGAGQECGGEWSCPGWFHRERFDAARRAEVARSAHRPATPKPGEPGYVPLRRRQEGR